MNKVIHGACISLLLAIAGCKSETPVVPADHSASQPPPFSPPPTSSSPFAECKILSFDRTSDVDVLPGGIWLGSLFDCDANVRYDYVPALVSEDGRFRVFLDDGHTLAGTLGTRGNVFDGGGIDFAGAGKEYFSGPTTHLWVQGTMTERQAMEGRWGTEWGSYGYFRFAYQPQAYESGSSFDALVGVWPLVWRYLDQTSDGVWTIEPDGRFSGQDESGCLQEGRFSMIDDRYSLLAVELTISGCFLSGSYTGLAYREELVDWWEAGITVSIDNGERPLFILMAK